MRKKPYFLGVGRRIISCICHMLILSLTYSELMENVKGFETKPHFGRTSNCLSITESITSN